MSSEEIKAELRALRAGRAVYAANLAVRLGDHLRLLCDTGGAAAVADPAVLRQRLISELNACAQRLPSDLATAVRAGLALHAEAADAQFQRRVDWLARHIGREHRTALRRIDEAEVLLAEEISRELDRRRASPLGEGWHVARFEVLVRLDTPIVEVYEERRIVADHDGLDEIAVGVSLPSATENAGIELQTEIRHGARLLRSESPLPHRSHLAVALPRPLAVGQTHDWGVVTRITGGQLLRPHYVLTATRRYELFRLRIRFHPDRLPRWARRVAGEPVRLLDAPRATGDLLEIDAVGEVRTEFIQPAMYLAYGIQFCPAGRQPETADR